MKYFRDKLLTIDKWDTSISQTINVLFKKFMTGDGRRIETEIDQIYMENLYKIPISLMPLSSNITNRFEKFQAIASADIAVLIEEETEVFAQQMQRIEITILQSDDNLSSSFVRETLGNLTEDYLTQCKINHKHFESIHRVHVDFLINHFDQDDARIVHLIEDRRPRFRFIEFKPIQSIIDNRMDEMKRQGNSTIDLLTEAWFVATSQLFDKIAIIKADVSMEMDRINEIIAPSNILYDAQRPMAEKTEEIVIKTFNELNKNAEEFTIFEKEFMIKAVNAFISNAKKAQVLYDPKNVREPQRAYMLAGIYVNQIAHRAFEEFYDI